MARVTKCRSCLVKDQSEKVKVDNMYFHDGECLDKYRKHKQFLEKEKQQKDELFYKLLKIHNIEKTIEIPPLFYMKIEEIRNDSGLLGKVDKRYKEGVPYNAISYTYDYCKKNIENVLLNMNFENKLGEMYYCLAIVRNNIVDAYNHKLNQMKQEKIQKEVVTQDMSLDYETPKRIRKDEMDISDIL
ncbi:hypothetical protein [Paenibacillus naphthalenovorans]|uniref:Uncharacterized protein n=1 Tax=Paenibacillus naphthalenovorans TaxID=162209 RepID=A0A0U2MWB6_9BACL|nr:hypothetical protein [Paenibacillus naphthalenovorans]ALS22143.1 hypothetical protein IJ22_17690 [Paenibacillus naphthalenovorans]